MRLVIGIVFTSFIALNVVEAESCEPQKWNGFSNRWLTDKTQRDTIGCQSFVETNKFQFTNNHLGQNSAGRFSRGYAKLPEGTYVSGKFTISAFVKVRSHGSWQRLIDFSNGNEINNVGLALSNSTSGKPTGIIHTAAGGMKLVTSSRVLPFNIWTHVAFVYDGQFGIIYMNGEEVGREIMNPPERVVRKNCFIGRSSYGVDTDLNGDVADLRIAGTDLVPVEFLGQGRGSINIRNLKYLENEFASQTALFEFRGDINKARGELKIVERSMVQNTIGIFGEKNGAINFDNGFVALSPLSENHFQSDFIAMAWVRIRRHNDWQRLFDFGNGQEANNVVFSLSYETSGRPAAIFHTNAGNQVLTASKEIPLSVWTHVAFVYTGGFSYIYINGEEVGKAAMNRPARVVRSKNYIGKSNWHNDALLDGEVRDFRLSSRTLD